MVNADVEYPKVDALLHKLAWKAHGLSGLPFDELRSEASMAFLKCCNTYGKKHRMKFSSWVYQKVWFHLLYYLRKRGNDRLVYVEEIRDDMLPSDPHTALYNALEEQIQGLSLEAQELIRRLVDSPHADPTAPTTVLKNTCREIAWEKGWDNVYTKIVVHEIQNGINWKG